MLTGREDRGVLEGAPERITCLRRAPRREGPVLYWMGREQRARDHWGLAAAQELAAERRVPLACIFTLSPTFLGAPLRAYAFLLRGLRETARELAARDIPLFLLRGDPPEEAARFAIRHRVALTVTDFDPLRVRRGWTEAFLERTEGTVLEVDARNVVPCRFVSPKREWSAATLRRKLRPLLDRFLPFLPPPLETHPVPWTDTPPPSWDPLDLLASGSFEGVPESPLPPGSAAGQARLEAFLREGLPRYARDRNDPLREGQSGLSPYLHFGQISPQRAAWEVLRADAPPEDREAFLEELVVRGELAENFCLHTPGYDTVEAFPDWARKTLAAHASDRRPALYSLRELEEGRTHDPLWNAAQRELVLTGRMPGYLRMYWGKKLLEWTPSPEEALRAGVALNDRYELDGRDPKGYAGLAWCLGGVHDRPWPSRPVFGSVRSMTAAGMARKFDVEAYCRRAAGLPPAP